jgi:hypothetical protein
MFFIQHSSLHALTGIWFLEELRLALEEGYIISNVYSIYHFSDSSTTLFNNYIKTFYKIKMLASGKSEWCDSPEKFEVFIEYMEYFSSIIPSIRIQ